MTGKVKWFNDTKGYGFIVGEDNAESFVHFSNINMRGHRTLGEGQEVTFETHTTDRGVEAINVTPVV